MDRDEDKTETVASKRQLEGKENHYGFQSPGPSSIIGVATAAIHNPYSSSTKKKKATMPTKKARSNSDDVQVLTPPPRFRVAAALFDAEQQDDNENVDVEDKDDCVMELYSNLTNPNRHLPHRQPDCAVHKFANNESKYCHKCYCIICDEPAKDCRYWESHCTATSKPTEVIDLQDSPPKKKEDDFHPNDNHSMHTTAAQSYYARQATAAMMQNRIHESSGVGGCDNEVGIEHVHDNDDDDDDDDDGSEKDDEYTMLEKAYATLHGQTAHDHHYTKAFNEAYTDSNDGNKQTRGRSPKDMRITEVLAENLMNALVLAEEASSENYRKLNNRSTKATSAAAAIVAAAAAAAAAVATAAIAAKDNNDTVTTGGSNKTASQLFSSQDLQRKERFERSQMQGDIPQLGLHASFFVEGVRIGWPYPSILKPQRQMAIHLIKALKNSRHVVLESPTGTGKSAAILCSVLAWQRHHARSVWGQTVDEADKLKAIVNGESNISTTPFPRIIYCSRTHSQVAQMVASLKKTPYRPRMTVLGSRDRLCIHSNIRNKNPPDQGGDQINYKSTASKVNVTTACQIRVANTEKMRKALWKSIDYRYDDNNPPEYFPGDKTGIGQSLEQEDDDDMHDDDMHEDDDGDDISGGGDQISSAWILRNSTKKLTCPHYRQLTTARTSQMLRANFMVTQDKIDCCKSGGEKTAMGVHDIEDLVSFGVDPYLKENVALYRHDGASFGIDVGPNCKISNVKKFSAAESNGQVWKGDKILAVNGSPVHSLKQITDAISKTTKDPLELTLLKKKASAVGNGSTSQGIFGNQWASQVNSGVEERQITLHRLSNEMSFGMVLEGRDGEVSGCVVNKMHKGGPAQRSGQIRDGDYILAVNGVNVSKMTFDDVIDTIKATNAGDSLRLRIQRNVGVDDEEEKEDVYSEHSACPYYLSRSLAKYAEIIFAPYNYVLDPGIRNALELDLDGAVVVLDEAHNVESVLTESGSIKIGEIALTNLLAMLAHYASGIKNRRKADIEGSTEEKMDLTEISHELLLFVEKIITYMREKRGFFERSNGNCGAAKAIQEYQKWRTPDDTEFEVSYVGPNGHGVNNKAVGCKPFFDYLQFTQKEIDQLQKYAQALESQVGSGKSESGNTDGSSAGAGDQSKNGLFDLLNGLLGKIGLAVHSPEHFYVSCVVQANGNLDHASGLEGNNDIHRFKKKPISMPYISPRTERNPTSAIPNCRHKKCQNSAAATANPLGFGSAGVRHGEWCDGRHTPPWEAHLMLKLLNPGLLMKNVSNSCRSVVLASGSLSPLQSLCAELDLQGSEVSKTGRLQTKPPPLEADHVVNKQKQLLALAIGHFPDGTPLTVNYNNYKDPAFFGRLGDAIAQVIESIPSGGVLVFLPSYSMLNKCRKCWNPYEGKNGFRNRNLDNMEHSRPEIWKRFERSKGKVIVEPTGSQDAFEAARDDYADTIKNEGSCILLAVFRGKMSEGISFNDDNARGVICVGIPFPGARERSILAKKSYNDEQRKLRNRTGLLPGQDWYCQEAFRAIAQALGRCIRHEADYGTVVLLDSRHCNDGSPGFVHKNLPKWMRDSVRTLSISQNQGHGNNPVLGGYEGIRHEMGRFFAEAPVHARIVLEKRRKEFHAAQARDNDSSGERQFNSQTGSWIASKGGATRQPSTGSDASAAAGGVGVSCCGSSGSSRVTQESPAVPVQSPSSRDSSIKKP